MDMQPSPDTGNIPPEALQQLQQMQGGGGMDITAILAQLSQMSPDEVSGALQQLGINVPPAQLQQAAEDWVEQSAGKAAGEPTEPASEGEEGAAEEPPPSTPSQDDEAAETVPDDEAAEGEEDRSDAALPPNAMPTSGGGGANAGAMAAMMQQGGGAMPRGGAGGNIDALISAALSQGDPASMPAPTRGPPMRGASGPRVGSPAMPGAGVPSAAGDDPRLKAMLQSAYRQNAGTARKGVPTGPRGPQTGATARRK